MSALRGWALRRIPHPGDSPWTDVLHPRRYSSTADARKTYRKRAETSVSRRNPRRISTLNPSLITPADWIDISHLGTFVVRLSASKSVGSRLPYIGHRPSVSVSKTVDLAFPPRTHGFLYYHRRPHAHPLEGSIRFRLARDSSLASFSPGQDLCLPSGFPWEISLAQVACVETYADLGEQLVHENLATREQLSQLREIFAERQGIHPRYMLFSLDSPFFAIFSQHTTLSIVGDQLHRLQMDLFHDSQLRKHFWPWTGSAIARFERSLLPEHAGRRVIHLRFLKILEPAVCAVHEDSYRGRVTRPVEGQLFLVRNYRHPPAPWAYNIDKFSGNSSATALQVLWDNTPNLESPVVGVSG